MMTQEIHRKDALLATPTPQSTPLPKKTRIDIRNPVIARRTTGPSFLLSSSLTRRQELEPKLLPLLHRPHRDKNRIQESMFLAFPQISPKRKSVRSHAIPLVLRSRFLWMNYLCAYQFASLTKSLDPGILFSVLGKLKKVKLYTHPDGTKKGDALITFTKPEAVPVACAHVTAPSHLTLLIAFSSVQWKGYRGRVCLVCHSSDFR
jgi:hypothetical protein